MNRSVDIAVIGGGPAGLAAALEARKSGASVLLIERDKSLGGILQQCIHNGFGLHYFQEELTGPEYAARFIVKLDGSGIEVMTETFALSMSCDLTIACVSASDGVVTVKAKAIVLAMGCRERTRGALNIPGTRPAGVFSAGCAQRLANMEGYLPGNRAVILGSGDIGLIMARRLTFEGAKVEMVCELMPYSSGLNRNIVQCLDDFGIPLHFSTTVTRIHGRERMEGVTIASVDENLKPIPSSERYVACDTLLLSVGLIPENELTVGAGLELDPVTGGVRVDERRMAVPGIFACGNVLHVHDLVDNVSAEAAIAGGYAAKYALGQLSDPSGELKTTPGAGVRYVVPQRVTRGVAVGKTTLYFRVTDAYKPARVTVSSGGKTLVSRKKTIMTPGEMEHIDVDLSQVDADVTVSVEPA